MPTTESTNHNANYLIQYYKQMPSHTPIGALIHVALYLILDPLGGNTVPPVPPSSCGLFLEFISGIRHQYDRGTDVSGREPTSIAVGLLLSGCRGHDARRHFGRHLRPTETNGHIPLPKWPLKLLDVVHTSLAFLIASAKSLFCAIFPLSCL